jgi:hypothetical protein
MAEAARAKAMADELDAQTTAQALVMLKADLRAIRLALEQARLQLDAASDLVHRAERCVAQLDQAFAAGRLGSGRPAGHA